MNNVLQIPSFITLQFFFTTNGLASARWPILHHPTILLHHRCPSWSALTNPTPTFCLDFCTLLEEGGGLKSVKNKEVYFIKSTLLQEPEIKMTGCTFSWWAEN